MVAMLTLLQSPEVWQFLAAMIGISLAAFALAAVAKLHLFESLPGLLLLIIIVWSPNIAAYLMTSSAGTFSSWFAETTAMPQGIMPWLWACIPIVVVGATLVLTGEGNPESLDGRSVAMLVGLNLVLGPLGEEFGLRGYLLPIFLENLPFASATLLLGAIWALWHLPLWLVDSPQAKIPFVIFFATVLCFSVIMGKIYELSSGSIWPAVLFHFLVNAAVGWAEATGRFKENASYKLLLPGYAVVAAAILGSQLWA